MTSRARTFVLALSVPVIVFAVIGGYLGQVIAQGDETFRYLRVFEDVVSLVVSNYVEPVDVRRHPVRVTDVEPLPAGAFEAGTYRCGR